MLVPATAMVFLLVTVLTAFTGVRFWARSARSMARLGAPPRYAEAILPSASLVR